MIFFSVCQKFIGLLLSVRCAAWNLLQPPFTPPLFPQVVVTNTDALGPPQPFFHGLHTPLSTFVSPEFVTSYIKSGAEFLAVSNATPIDRTDAAAVSTDGEIIHTINSSSEGHLAVKDFILRCQIGPI
jgi:hypothetical protein